MPLSLADCAALYNAGDFAAAEVGAAALLESEPQNLKAKSLWAAAAVECGKIDAGVTAMREVLATGADTGLIVNLASRVFVGAGVWDEAATQLRRLLTLDPQDTGAQEMLASVLTSQRAYGEALGVYDDLAARGQRHYGVQRGTLHWQLGAYETAASLLGQHLETDPGDARALNQLGLVRKSQQRFDDALALFACAVEAKPGYERAITNLAVTHHECGSADAGRAALDTLPHELPRARIAFLKAMMLPVVLESADEISGLRQRFADDLHTAAACADGIADPLNEIGLIQFHLAYQAQDDRDLQSQAAQTLLKLCPELAYTAPEFADAPDGRPIRVGFVSTNLRFHTVGYLNLGFLTYLDRSRFEVTLVSLAYDGDEMYGQMATAADHVLTIPRDLGRAREIIAGGKFDILFYPDIGMEALTYYLAFARLAPVQAVSWGHPVTTGIPNIDYFVSCDAMEPGGSDEHYTETLVRLPDAGGHYIRPLAPDVVFNRAEYGLPDNAPLLACPQSCFKFHPDFDALLKSILEGAPRAHLALLNGVPESTSALLETRLKRTLGACASRVHFIGPLAHTDFLSLVRDADAVLDIPQWSGGRSGYEALAMGAPVVHLPGEFMRGRHTAAFYKVMGVDECIAADETEYVDIAVRLVTDKSFQGRVKQRIAEHAAHLFERMEPVRALEKFFEDAVVKL